jgi:tetratricopeptide (TPR) repeat protein
MRSKLICKLLTVLTISGCRTAQTKPASDQANTQPEIFQSAIPKTPDDFAFDKKAVEARFSKLKASFQTNDASGATAEQLYKLIRAARLAAKTSTEINSYAQRLMFLPPQRRETKWMSLAILELIRDAISQQKLDLAAYYLTKIESEKSPGIRSELTTAKGVISYLRGDFDSAIKLWYEAIRLDADNSAARINLGYLILRTGNANAVRRILEPIKDNWLATSGLVVAYRLLNQNKLAEDACKTLQKHKPNYEAGAVNCSLFFSQNMRDPKNAAALLDRVVKNSGRSDVAEYAFLLRSDLASPAEQDGSTVRPDGEMPKQ